MRHLLAPAALALLMLSAGAGCPFNSHSRGDLFSAGASFQKNGDLELAAAMFRRVIDAHPNDAAAWRHLAECEAGLGRVDAATTAYRRYLELKPGALALVKSRLTAMGVDPIVLANRAGADDVEMVKHDEVKDFADHPPLGGKRVSDEMLGEWAPRGTYYPGGAGAPAGVFGAILPTRLEKTTPGPSLTKPAWSAATDERGTVVAIGSDDGTLRLLPFGAKAPAITLDGSGAVLATAVDPSGKRVVWAGTRGEVRVHTAAGEKVARLTGASGPIRSVALERGGKRAYGAGDAGELLAWEVDDADLERRIKLAGPAVALRLSPEARYLAVALADGKVQIFDPISGTLEHTLSDHDKRATGVAFTGDGRVLVTSSWDGTVRVYRSGSWEPMAVHPMHAHIVTTLCAGARVVITGSADLRLKVWEAETGIELLHLPGHTAEIESVAVSADGRRITSVDYGGSVRFWELR